MRFRLIRRGTAAHSAVPEKPAPITVGMSRVKRGGPAAGFTFDRTAKPVQRPEPEKPVSLAQALDNPYGRYYGKARSREELLKNR